MEIVNVELLSFARTSEAGTEAQGRVRGGLRRICGFVIAVVETLGYHW